MSTKISSSSSKFQWSTDFLANLDGQLQAYITFLEPTDREQALRYWILHRLRHAFKSNKTFPHGYSMHEFGSFSTGHYLSYGDIDLTIRDDGNNMGETQVLEAIELVLKGEAWVSYSSIQCILDASIPVLKFKTKKWMGGIAVDIVGGHWSGMQSSNMVKSWNDQYLFLRPLVLVLKEWLRNHSYDVVYQGGLGGFALMNLLLLIFITYPDVAHGDFPLIRYLILFIQVIGKRLDTSQYAVAINGGPLVKKDRLHPSFKTSSAYPNALVIIDPSDESNNVAKSSYRFSTLALDLFDTLKVLESSHSRFKARGEEPILEKILQISREDVTKARNRSERAMWTIERTYSGLSLSIHRSSHLDQIDAFLKPSQKDFYDIDEDGKKVELDSSSSSEEEPMEIDSEEDFSDYSKE